MLPALSLLIGTILVAPAPGMTSPTAEAFSASTQVVAMAGDSTKTESFGDSITLDRRAAVDVGTVVSTPSLHGQPVLIKGAIIDVCTKKGCWLVVTDGTTRMRVTFKDYAFFVPKDATGGTVLLQGVVSRQEVSEDDARHYAGESTIGEKPEDINGPQQVVTMVATGVTIVR